MLNKMIIISSHYTGVSFAYEKEKQQWRIEEVQTAFAKRRDRRSALLVLHQRDEFRF